MMRKLLLLVFIISSFQIFAQTRPHYIDCGFGVESFDYYYRFSGYHYGLWKIEKGFIEADYSIS